MALMNSPADLAALGDESEAADNAAEEQSEGVKICIAIDPAGQITVYDEAGGEPVPAKSLQDAAGIAVKLATQAASNAITQGSAEAQAQRPGNEDAQSIWDQLAAERPNRMNT